MIELLKTRNAIDKTCRRHCKPLVFLFLLILASLVAAQAVTQSRYLFASDQGMRLLQVINLTSSEPSIDLVYPGKEIVDNPEFAPFVGHTVYRSGHWYSVFPLSSAILDIPFYRWLGAEGLYVIPGLSLIAIGLFTYLLASIYLRTVQACMAALLTALGSPLFFYGVVNWEHTLATALVTAGVLFLWLGLERDRIVLVAFSGGLISIACWIRPEAYVFLTTVALYLIIFTKHNRTRYFLHYFAGIILTISPLILFNVFAYGSPLGLQVDSNYSQGLQILTSLEFFFPITSKRWLLIYTLIIGVVVFFRIAPTPFRLTYTVVAIEVSAIIVVITTLFYLTDRWGISSFVEASPWMVLVPWVLVRSPMRITNQGSNRTGVIGLLFLCITFTILVLMLSPITGGSQWGGRFFLLAAPMWVILSFIVYNQIVADVQKQSSYRIRRFSLPVALYAIVICSMITQMVSLEFLSSVKGDWERLGYSINELPHNSVIATNSWWVPLVLAPDFYDYNFFYTASDEAFCELSHALFQEGFSSISMVSTPELPNALGAECIAQGTLLMEKSREDLLLWTHVVIQSYTILPSESQN